jgi:hypothetical protein
VLSAVGRTAVEEWQGLYAAVTGARAAGLPINVTLFAGEKENLIDVVTQLGDEDIDVRPVPNTGAALRTALRSLEPHLLHLYCHGTIASGVRFLEIGTIGDFIRDNGVSTVHVRVEELGLDMAAAATWAVVLNTCRGAEATDEALTHAEAVVSSGVPVAVGMRRLVDADDATAFSGAFYPAVFAAIKRAFDGAAKTIEWADTLVQARQVLRDRHGSDPALDEKWTLPVLYTRIGPFELVPAVAAGETATTRVLGESQTVDGIVDVLGESAPADLLEDLRGLAPPEA